MLLLKQPRQFSLLTQVFELFYEVMTHDLQEFCKNIGGGMWFQ